MDYFCQRLCGGYSKEKKPCEYIDKCDLCIGFSIDENSNEVYMCGIGVADFKCKRDNPNFKPITKDEFLKAYKEIPIKAKQKENYYFEVTMLDGSVRQFYRGNVTMHYIVPNDPNPKITFNLIEL